MLKVIARLQPTSEVQVRKLVASRRSPRSRPIIHHLRSLLCRAFHRSSVSGLGLLKGRGHLSPLSTSEPKPAIISPPWSKLIHKHPCLVGLHVVEQDRQDSRYTRSSPSLILATGAAVARSWAPGGARPLTPTHISTTVTGQGSSYPAVLPSFRLSVCRPLSAASRDVGVEQPQPGSSRPLQPLSVLAIVVVSSPGPATRRRSTLSLTKTPPAAGLN